MVANSADTRRDRAEPSSRAGSAPRDRVTTPAEAGPAIDRPRLRAPELSTVLLVVIAVALGLLLTLSLWGPHYWPHK